MVQTDLLHAHNQPPRHPKPRQPPQLSRHGACDADCAPQCFGASVTTPSQLGMNRTQSYSGSWFSRSSPTEDRWPDELMGILAPHTSDHRSRLAVGHHAAGKRRDQGTELAAWTAGVLPAQCADATVSVSPVSSGKINTGGDADDGSARPTSRRTTPIHYTTPITPSETVTDLLLRPTMSRCPMHLWGCMNDSPVCHSGVIVVCGALRGVRPVNSARRDSSLIILKPTNHHTDPVYRWSPIIVIRCSGAP